MKKPEHISSIVARVLRDDFELTPTANPWTCERCGFDVRETQYKDHDCLDGEERAAILWEREQTDMVDDDKT